MTMPTEKAKQLLKLQADLEAACERAMDSAGNDPFGRKSDKHIMHLLDVKEAQLALDEFNE